MRILLVTPFYAPASYFGGPVTVSKTMVEDLIAAGHEVTVATTDALGAHTRVPAAAPAEPPGAHIVRFPNVSHRLAVAAGAWNPRGARSWMQAHAGEFDVVHLLDFYTALSVAAARAAARAGRPIVLQPLGSLAPTRERGKPLIKRAFLRAWGRQTLDDAAALVHSTDEERDDFIAAGGAPDRLVEIGLPLELPVPGERREAAEPTLLHVGRLHPIKGIDRLLEATALARRRVPGLRLELIGAGDHLHPLEALARRLRIADAVTFRGWVPAEEKLASLRRAHVFCLLSRSEGLPVAALEAMACGTPVVLSTGCHLREAHGRAGIVVGETARDAADAVVELTIDPARRERLGRGGQELAGRFDRAVVMPEMIGLFERLAGR